VHNIARIIQIVFSSLNIARDGVKLAYSESHLKSFYHSLI